jgi:hypothetical protein
MGRITKAVLEEKKKSQGPARLNLLIDPELKEWVHDYARRMNTTVTSIVIAYFVSLREKEKDIGVEQI